MFTQPMGTFLHEYCGGMCASIGVMHMYNKPVKHKAKLEFSSERKAQSVHSNIFMSIALGGSTAKSVCSDKGRQYLTTAPIDNEWFGCFMTGLRVCVGERRRQDAEV